MDIDIPKKIKVSPLWCQVKDTLENEIIYHRIPPGSYIKDTVLAKQFGVSRGPIREALLCLQNEGWVEFKHNYGVYVKEPNPEEITQVLEVRQMVESRSAQLAAKRITQEQLDELENILWQSKRANEEKDYELVVELNNQFHGLIVKATQNTVLQKIHEQYLKKVAWYLTVVIRESVELQAVKEHELLLQALRDRDSERAINILSKHNETTLDLIMASLNEKE